MVKLLAKIGRFNAVVIMTFITTAASVAVTAAAVALFNRYGFDIRFQIAIAFAAGVPLAVAPPIGWYLIGLMLQLHEAEKEMRKLASYDTLTGLLSRYAFFDGAGNYYSLAKRERTVFSVMIVDLDHFKSINDNYGHPAGDAVLKLFSDVVNSVTRRSDIVGRLGGEEFAILLPSTPTAEAIELSDRLHQAINTAVLKYNDVIISYTASIGIASFDPKSNDSIEEMIARADLALYQAKRSGRNQTATFNPEIKQVAAS